MNVRMAVLLLVVPLAGCMVGPGYHKPTAVPPGQRLGVTPLPDSERVFFDSLAAARQRDSIAVAGTPIVQRPLVIDTATGLSWVTILRDTTLLGLIHTALHQNRNLQTAVARVQEYRADAGVARSALLPTVSVNGSVSGNEVAFGAFPPMSYHATRLTADASWEPDFWGEIRHGLAAANDDVAAQQAAERATALTLVSDVATSYLQLLELDQEHAIAEQTLASRRATLALARTRYAHGLISELDVEQFEAQVAAPAVTLAETERERAQTEHALDVLLGEGPTRIPRGTSLTRAVDALVVPDSVSAALLARRPDVEEAEHVYAASVARLGVADAARLPAITLSGSYGSQSQAMSQLFGTDTHVYQLQAGISIPIFNFGKLGDEAKAARAEVQQARDQFEQTALSAMSDASDALVAVHTARDQVAAQKTQVHALEQALDLAQLRYSAGLSSYLDLLDAQRSLFTAQLALSQSELQQLTAAVQLYKALGGSWPKGK